MTCKNQTFLGVFFYIVDIQIINEEECHLIKYLLVIKKNNNENRAILKTSWISGSRHWAPMHFNIQREWKSKHVPPKGGAQVNLYPCQKDCTWFGHAIGSIANLK